MAPGDLKSELRRFWRVKRRELARLHPEAPAKAAAAFPDELVRPGHCAALYHPLGGEMDPGPLAERLRAHKMGICLPVVEKLNAPLIFRSWSAHTVFAPDALGVRAPDPRSPETRPDLVVCPLLAFDAKGHRLGQGGGYYDRTLHQMRLEGPIVAIGLAFAEQEVEALPADDLDQRLDGILTENGYRAFP